MYFYVVRTLKYFSGVLLGLGSLVQFSVGQQSAPFSPQDMSTWKLYSAFFARVRLIESMADKDEAAGIDPRKVVRSTIKTEAGLTDEQDSNMRAIAEDSNAAVDILRQQRSVIIQQFKSQNPGATSPTPAVSQQVADVDMQAIQIVLNHVQQLKSAFGDAAFQRFDGYVNMSIGPHIIKVPLQSQQSGQAKN